MENFGEKSRQGAKSAEDTKGLGMMNENFFGNISCGGAEARRRLGKGKML